MAKSECLLLCMARHWNFYTELKGLLIGFQVIRVLLDVLVDITEDLNRQIMCTKIFVENSEMNSSVWVMNFTGNNSKVCACIYLQSRGRKRNKKRQKKNVPNPRPRPEMSQASTGNCACRYRSSIVTTRQNNLSMCGTFLIRLLSPRDKCGLLPSPTWKETYNLNPSKVTSSILSFPPHSKVFVRDQNSRSWFGFNSGTTSLQMFLWKMICKQSPVPIVFDMSCSVWLRPRMQKS